MAWGHIPARVTMAVSVIGLFGNVLCAIILGKVQKNIRGVRLTKYLTIVDILVLLMYVFPGAVVQSFRKARVILDIINCINFLLIPAAHTVYMFEIYLTILIGVQRCSSLAMPLKFERSMKDSVVNVILICIGVFTVVFNVPIWVSYKPSIYWNNNFNMTLVRSIIWVPAEFVSSFNIVISVFYNGIPIVALVVCNTILIISRRRMTRTGHTGDRTRANKLTTIIVTITFTSVVMHCLSIVNCVAFSYMSFGEKNILTDINSEVVNIKDLMISVNCSANFAIYYCLGQEFRQTLTSVFRRDRRIPQHRRQDDLDLADIHSQTQGM